MAAIIHISDENFEQEVLKSDTPVLVDFWAEWCAPCRMIAPIVDDLANEYQGRVKIAKVDVDKCANVSTQYAVTSIPTLILFKSGQPVEKIVGAVSKNKLKGLVDGSL
jgi:thioredoxin 1